MPRAPSTPAYWYWKPGVPCLSPSAKRPPTKPSRAWTSEAAVLACTGASFSAGATSQSNKAKGPGDPGPQPPEDKTMIRVMEFGVASYWPRTMAQALEMAQTIIARNGCGLIQINNVTVYRFERWTG